jgi:hypothetical protein
MAFGEYVTRDQSPIYRVGMMMSIADAKELLETLGEAISEAELQASAENSMPTEVDLESPVGSQEPPITD